MYRSLLFMPGNNPGMLVSADVLGADMVVFDLEDAVALSEKDSARILVRNALRTLKFRRTKVGVRVNPTDSPYWEEDLEEIVPCEPDAIVIPKSDWNSVPMIESRLGNIPTFLLIESARSLVNTKEVITSSKNAIGLILGGEDYSQSMGIKRSASYKELEFARFTLATFAKAFGLDAIDTPYTDVENIEGLKKDTEFAKSIGMNGRLLIGPRHVRYVHEIFSPTKKEIEEAKEILEEGELAKKEGRGAFSHHGKMVDLPVLKRASDTVKNAEIWGLI